MTLQSWLVLAVTTIALGLATNAIYDWIKRTVPKAAEKRFNTKLNEVSYTKLEAYRWKKLAKGLHSIVASVLYYTAVLFASFGTVAVADISYLWAAPLALLALVFAYLSSRNLSIALDSWNDIRIAEHYYQHNRDRFVPPVMGIPELEGKPGGE